MPYTFHASTPTLYPSADTLFPASAETLTWFPAPYVEPVHVRSQAAERVLGRLMARRSLRMIDAMEGLDHRTGRLAVSELVREGLARVFLVDGGPRKIQIRKRNGRPQRSGHKDKVPHVALVVGAP